MTVLARRERRQQLDELAEVNDAIRIVVHLLDELQRRVLAHFVVAVLFQRTNQFIYINATRSIRVEFLKRSLSYKIQIFFKKNIKKK